MLLHHLKAPRGLSRMIARADNILRDYASTRRLINGAARKLARLERHVREWREDITTLFRLIVAWSRGQYRAVPWQSVLMGTGAIVYFVMPLDSIPDFLGPWGLSDDAAVFAFVFNAIRADLDAFRHYEAKVETDKSEGESLDDAA